MGLYVPLLERTQIKRWLEQLEGEEFVRDESLDGKMIVYIL